MHPSGANAPLNCTIKTPSWRKETMRNNRLAWQIKFGAAIAVGTVLVLFSVQAYSATSIAEAGESIDQKNLCEVDSWRFDEVAAACRPGQKVAFVPKSFGNEQLPVIFAAVNCDLRYSIALTNGAVACIYGPITPVIAEPVE
jgi:hypothetical protein